MPDVYIKTPSLDAIFQNWKNTAYRQNKKKLEKEFGTKGSVFSLDAISAAEYVKDNQKEAAIYFAMKKTIAPVKGQDEIVVPPQRLSKETFYTFKGGKVKKDNWKGPDKVPLIETIKAVPCKTCSGRGFMEQKCKSCKGKGKIEENWVVLEGENQDKMKKIFDYPCAECYGTGNQRLPCRDCKGHKNQYKYSIGPVPFITVVTGIPVLHSSAGAKLEREIEKDLHQVIQEVEGIKFNDAKSLSQKAEASLGYMNKSIKKTISTTASDYQKTQKAADSEVVSPIHLFPMIVLFCETKRGSKFEIYSVGSGSKFRVYSSF